MGLTGFNPSEVQSSIRSVISAYNQLIAAIHDDMQNQFVKGMSDKWACKQAQDFFKEFKKTVDELITKSSTTFKSVVDAMNSAGKAWADNTKSSYTKTSFTEKTTKIDISSIKENINGVRGVDKEQADNVAAKLPIIAKSAATALDNAKRAVGTCGFVGGNQASSLQNSLETIKTNINKAVSDIATAAEKAIKTTSQNYSTTANKISNAFKGE